MVEALKRHQWKKLSSPVDISESDEFILSETFSSSILWNGKEENFTSPRMKSTNNRQTVFVVNRNAVESTNDIWLGYAALEKLYYHM